MISCVDFIPAYSELFKYLHERGGEEGVKAFWNMLADDIERNSLGKLMREKGLAGCWEYWSKSLNEEAADFTMTLDEEAGEFCIDMHYCPSKGRFQQPGCEHIAPYERYCEHCAIYEGAARSAGCEYKLDLSNADRAACRIVITAPKPPQAAQSAGVHTLTD